ncbi:hypothetical protein [Streptomyces sp. G-G2]|uniref:hypothetical protein n=1 Tax=Streptomyces sp. G-G2 TaxID=3046201 RepID=UPI0024B8CA70|nr:hypothetical protein [Streptomyces sp. G-G2]MDJ0380708.1 hypothetical protein [Streptomyces sp. G-G2]
MSDHDNDEAARASLARLQTALSAHGITLPSLGIDPPSFAGSYRIPPLIALGNCNVATADRLADALRGAAAGR